MMTINPNSKLYRFATIYRSFKAIYQLPPEKIDAFFKSYDIYDCDWVDSQAIRDSKVVEYKEVKENIINWYSVLNFLCAAVQVEKMYIPPTLDLNNNIITNQMMFEQRFAKLLGMKKNDKVFELGCGRGRVAAHLASTTGANITAINIDQVQLDSAIDYANKNNLSKQCKFMNSDFNDLPFSFADNQFDAIYEIQALSLSRNLEKLFLELNRVLKPGGKISLLEWVRLPNYNPEDPHHAELLKKVKPFVGAIGTPSPAEYESILNKTGFDVIVSEDPSVNKTQVPLFEKSNQFCNKLFPIIHFLVKIKVLPKHFSLLFDKLIADVGYLAEADSLGLVTTSYHIVAQKRK